MHAAINHSELIDLQCDTLRFMTEIQTGTTAARRFSFIPQTRMGSPSIGLSVLRLPLLMALTASPAYAAGDMVSNFLTSIVSLITSTWAIAIVVIATFYVGYLFFFSDRRTHEHLSGWLFGCIFVLGCQVLAQQFIH